MPLISWQAFLSVSLILGDGLYNFVKILAATIINILERVKNRDNMGNTSNLRTPYNFRKKLWNVPFVLRCITIQFQPLNDEKKRSKLLNILN